MEREEDVVDTDKQHRNFFQKKKNRERNGIIGYRIATKSIQRIDTVKLLYSEFIEYSGLDT